MDINERLAAIEARNDRVESDKAWETSLTRRGLIVGLTYILAGVYLMMIHREDPWVLAVVPAGGYFLSTLVLSIAKARWAARRPRR
jgi:hypothetical protein